LIPGIGALGSQLYPGKSATEVHIKMMLARAVAALLAGEASLLQMIDLIETRMTLLLCAIAMKGTAKETVMP